MSFGKPWQITRILKTQKEKNDHCQDENDMHKVNTCNFLTKYSFICTGIKYAFDMFFSLHQIHLLANLLFAYGVLSRNKLCQK